MARRRERQAEMEEVENVLLCLWNSTFELRINVYLLNPEAFPAQRN